MRCCIDTNVIIDVFRGDKKLGFKLAKYQESFCITPTILCELYKGAFLSKDKRKAVFLLDAFKQSAELLSFDQKACELFGRKYAEMKKRGNLTQEADLMIACVAMSHRVPLITRNKKRFENIKGLKLIVV